MVLEWVSNVSSPLERQLGNLKGYSKLVLKLNIDFFKKNNPLKKKKERKMRTIKKKEKRKMRTILKKEKWEQFKKKEKWEQLKINK